TINDVLFGVVSSGLTRYLDLQSSNKIKEGLQITGLAMVNIRKQPGLQEFANLMKNKSSSRWGNQFGFIQLPLYYHKDINDPLQYVKRTKAMLDRKKLSLEAYFTYRIGKLVMSLLGPKVAALLNYRIICNTSFTISNVVGPQEEIMFAENPIAYMRVNSTSLAHAITMHMVSYNGNAYMQILVAKDIIPNPKVLVKCFQDALLEMKNAATIKEGTMSNGSVIHS
ncbi:O-acyltransferase wsd1-like, partial [Thalictrum thalictroides]